MEEGDRAWIVLMYRPGTSCSFVVFVELFFSFDGINSVGDIVDRALLLEKKGLHFADKTFSEMY